MLRRRTEPFRIHQVEKHNWLSDGQFTDEEAFSLVTKQYLTGGNTNMTDRLAELPEDRRALLRHIMPAFAPPARILDLDRPNCPTLALTSVEPSCETLGAWRTLSVSNWDDAPVTRNISLALAGSNADESVKGRLDTKWDYPAKIHALIPSNRDQDPVHAMTTVAPGCEFALTSANKVD